MEVRGLIEETVTRRNDYGGMSAREWKIRRKDPTFREDILLEKALKLGFKDVSREIALLFNPDDPYGILFPDPADLRKIIKILNEDITEEDWKSEDILGWIYQFWNEQERRRYRTGRGRGSRKGPEPDDIPVINQLYTPHWVVKALVDNTLGRLWLEMKGRCPWEGNIRQGSHPNSIENFCSYLVPLSSEPQKIKQKHPKEIKILDPACGSGHFLIYAFEVMWHIWLEEMPDISPEELAANILEHNLYGIDIDTRACELSALGLYLKAKELIEKELKKRGIPEDETKERVKAFRPRKMNIISADISILDGKRKEAFLKLFENDPDLYQIAERLVDDLGYTYELGSLIKVREPFDKLFKVRKKTAFELRNHTQQLKLFKPEKIQLRLGDVKVTVPPELTIKDIERYLELFEKQAFERHSIGDIIFSIDAARSLGLLSVLMKKYNVVLMNPPYGDVTPKAKAYLKKHYAKTHNDVYSAFIEQAVDLTEEGGYIGMLTNLTFMYLSSHRWLRENLLKEKAPPKLILEFGLGILDGASVYTSGTILRKEKREPGEETLFLRLTEPSTEEKEKLFCEILSHILEEKLHPELFKASLEDLDQVPGTPYAYWASPSLRKLFSKYPPLDRDGAKRSDQPKIADVKVGLQTSDDTRFTRRWWEVDRNLFAKNRDETFEGKKWVPFAKNESFYFREGLTWQYVNTYTWLTRTRYLPKDCIFGHSGNSIFINESQNLFPILAFENSALKAYLIGLMTNQRRHEVSMIAMLPISQKLLGNQKLSIVSRQAHDILREWDTGNEISTVFIKPWLAQVAFGWNTQEMPKTGHPFAEQFEWADWEILKELRAITGNTDMPLKELARLVLKREDMLIKHLAKIQHEIDETVYDLYEISPEDRILIEKELKRMKRSKIESENEEENHTTDAQNEIPPEIRRLFPPLKSPYPVEEERRIQEHVKKLLSWYAKRAIEEDEDGIVPLDTSFPDNLYDRVRGLFIREWGEERTVRLLDEIYEILGKSLEDWLTFEYFPYHVSLYKNRPIFWLLWAGRQRRKKPSFACFINYHKLDQDTLYKTHTLYLERTIEELKTQRSYLQTDYLEMDETQRKSRKGKSILKKRQGLDEAIMELEEFAEKLLALTKPLKNASPLPENASWLQQKIREIREQGYSPNPDYGVLVNITPLKEAGILHPEANRIK